MMSSTILSNLRKYMLLSQSLQQLNVFVSGRSTDSWFNTLPRLWVFATAGFYMPATKLPKHYFLPDIHNFLQLFQAIYISEHRFFSNFIRYSLYPNLDDDFLNIFHPFTISEIICTILIQLL